MRSKERGREVGMAADSTEWKEEASGEQAAESGRTPQDRDEKEPEREPEGPGREQEREPEGPEAGESAVEKPSRKRTAVEFGVYLAVLAAVYVIFHYILMLGRIPSESMEPTLMVHDWTVGSRLAYEEEAPERGDMIIFYSKEEETSMCKRVIGLAGEEVSFVGGHVYIDGAPLDESAYLDEDVVTESSETFAVPDGCIFVMGDNREDSYDSRLWENPYIRIDDIQSKIFFVVPFHKLPWFS